MTANSINPGLGVHMNLSQLPNLTKALTYLGLDCGADVITEALVPVHWRIRARLAEKELVGLTTAELEALTQGEETEQRIIAAKAPNADALLFDAFDGDLSDVFFSPWASIYDARRAERRFNGGG